VLENLGECPEGYTLDRINNDGHYEPGNLRWASRLEQNINRRNAGVMKNKPPGKSGYKWVEAVPTGYVARFTYKGKRYYAGHFSTPEAASKAARELRLSVAGEG